jgi:hypothetical protein
MADLGGWPSSDDVNRQLAEEEEGIAILSFSAGKDSVGSWLAMKAAGFHHIVPVYLYLVPDLQFVEAGLRYYEDRFETGIVRLPHPSLHRWLNDGLFQTPDTTMEITKADLPAHDYDDVFDALRLDYELGHDRMAALGVRAADSPNRWASIKARGPVNRARRTWFPIYDWTADRLRAELRAHKLKLTADYRVFGRSFDGLDARFLLPMRQVWPDDYERVRQFFPLVDTTCHRHEMFWPQAVTGILSAVAGEDGVKASKTQKAATALGRSRGSQALVGRTR